MPDTTLPLMLFAAGFGTRMRPLTLDRPKPLIEVSGRPLIDHAIDLGHDAGCAPIVANLHYKAAMLEAHLAPLGVKTVTEAPDILDTGGGLRHALPALGDGPVMTLNPDAIWIGSNPLQLLKAHWRPERMDALLVCVPTKKAEGHEGSGDFVLDSAGRIARGAAVIYGGAQIIKTELLAGIRRPAFSLNEIWDLMASQDRVFGLTYSGRWCDVGHPGGIATAEKLLADADV